MATYSILRDKWKFLLPFPFKICSSSIGVLQGCWLYNIGGQGSEWGVARLALGSEDRKKQWSEVRVREQNKEGVRELQFDWWTGNGLHAIGKRIFFFGSSWSERAAFILEEQEDNKIPSLVVVKKCFSSDFTS